MPASDEDVFEAKKNAVMAFLRRRTVPIRTDDPTLEPIRGTGSLFRFGNRSYFVTARHVLDKADFDHIGIPVTPSEILVPHFHEGRYVYLKQAPILTFYNATRSAPDDEEHDVAVLALKDEELVDKLQESWGFLSAENLLGSFRGIDTFLIAGFPNAVERRIGGEPLFPMFVLRTRLRPRPPEEYVYNRDTDLILDYPKKIYSSEGQAVEAPQLQGISGCLVWAVVPNEEPGRIWQADNHVKVAAVDSSCVRSKFVRAKKMNVFAAIFREIDKAAAAQIDAAIHGGP